MGTRIDASPRNIMSTNQKYAILVDCGTRFRFVTQILIGKTAEWNADQQALLFSNRAYAKDIATGLCLNGFPAMLVEVPSYMENLLVNKD